MNNRSFFLTLLSIGAVIVLFFVIAPNCKKSLPTESNNVDKNLSIDWQNKFRGDTSTKDAVREAIVYARERCGLVDKVVIDSSYTDALAYEAFDIIKGESRFTRVSLSKKEGVVVIHLFPIGYKSNNREDKTLSVIILELLTDYSIKEIDKARRNG